MNLEKYTFPTKNGKLLSTQDFPNGNMLRSTAELLFLAENQLELSDIHSLEEGMLDCLVSDQKNHGLCYSRYPDRAENTSVDDLLVIGAQDMFSAQRILTCARSNFGFYSVDGKWTWPQFIFRFQGMWQTLRMSAQEEVGLLAQLIWALSVYLAAREPITNQDSWLLSDIMILTYIRNESAESSICNAAVEYWKSKKTRASSDIMSDYLGPDHQDHPLIEAWKPYG